MKKWRNPSPDELDSIEFNAVWETIKRWDIGTPSDVANNGVQFYDGATGSHVMAILDSLRIAGKLCA